MSVQVELVQPSATSTQDVSFNIVNFIENNPIAKLSNTYNNKLLTKIKEQFTESQQQLFISSFYCYLNYHSTNDFVIDLDNIWKWLGFNTKQNSKTVIIKNMNENTEYKISLMQPHKRTKESKGGQNKEIILLTVNAFKKLCLKAGTKKADEIHNYFIKLEEIMHEVVKEECEELKKELENKTTELENKNIEIKTLKKANELDRHNILCQQYDKKRLVYILKIETLINGDFIIKVGETMDIKQRCQAISADFGIRVLIMDLFPCDLNYEFEQFLHRHPILYRHKYTNLINNNKKSTESYIIKNNNSYNKIKQFIQKNMIKYNSKNGETIKYTAINNIMEAYKDDKEKMKQMIEHITKTELPISREQYSQLQTEVDAEELCPNLSQINEITMETTAILENIIIENTTQPLEPPKSKPNSYSPKVQIYNPNDLTKVVKVFDSITEATREIKDSSYTHIKYADRHRTIYKNYRWHLVSCTEKNLYESKPIGQTVDSKQRRTGFVAQLNLEKTKVLKVFRLQKEVADECNTHTSLICTAIRYGSVLCGSNWIIWDDLDEQLKTEFLQTNELPKITNKSKGSRVQQINPQTRELVREFPSITDATKEMKISTKTIKKSSEEEIPMNGWLWKIL